MGRAEERTRRQLWGQRHDLSVVVVDETRDDFSMCIVQIQSLHIIRCTDNDDGYISLGDDNSSNTDVVGFLVFVSRCPTLGSRVRVFDQLAAVTHGEPLSFTHGGQQNSETRQRAQM